MIVISRISINFRAMEYETFVGDKFAEADYDDIKRILEDRVRLAEGAERAREAMFEDDDYLERLGYE